VVGWFGLFVALACMNASSARLYDAGACVFVTSVSVIISLYYICKITLFTIEQQGIILCHSAIY